MNKAIQNRRLINIWWLKPDLLVAGFILPALWLFYFLSSPILLQRNVVDFFSFGACVALSALLLLYMVGARFSYKLRLAVIKVPHVSERWLHFFFLLTIFAYSIWFVPIILNFGIIAAILSGAPGAVYMARDLLATMPGITTFTQAGIAFMCVYAIQAIDGLSTSKWIKREAALIILLAAFRTLVMSERLALIEVLVPIIPVFLINARVKSKLVRQLLIFSPYIGVFGLLLFFGATEYFRSWVNYYDMRSSNYSNFIVNRVATYYIYAINSGLGAIDKFSPDYNFPVYSFYWILHMPIIGDIVTKDWHAYIPTQAVLDRYADPQFNNISGIVAIVWDFGWIGAMFVFMLSGILTGLAWKGQLAGRGALRYFYPILYIALLDLLREPYLGLGRAFVPIMLLIIMIFSSSYKDAASRVYLR